MHTNVQARSICQLPCALRLLQHLRHSLLLMPVLPKQMGGSNGFPWDISFLLTVASCLQDKVQ